jgi:hypothetical protein
LSDFVPLQVASPPTPEHELAPVEVHDRVVDPPGATAGGFAEMATVGAGGIMDTVTLPVADPPPAFVQVKL